MSGRGGPPAQGAAPTLHEPTLHDEAAHDEALTAAVHELRTPLTAIRALAELMLDSPDMDPAERKGFLSIIVDETARLGRLVDGILDAAKLETAFAEWQMAPLDPAALLRDAAAVVRPVLAARGVGLELDLAPVPAIRGDRDRLFQVALNLLSNAGKFAPLGQGRVTLALRAAPGGIEVSVTDNGPGIPAAEREAIFQPWHQSGQQSGQQSGHMPGAAGDRPKGTGLGLPLARAIARRHGGSLVAEPAPQGGARLVLTLPLDPAEREGSP